MTVENEHYPVDDGYCSCGVLCETGTRFNAHLQAMREREKLRYEAHAENPYLCDSTCEHGR